MNGKCRLLKNPDMMSLIKEVRVKSYTDSIFLSQGDDISRTLERIHSKQPYYTTLDTTLLICLSNPWPGTN